MFKYQATDLGITLEAEIDCEESLACIREVFGDKRRYLQILANFISNSLKFTDKGGKVTVSIWILEQQEIKEDIENNVLQKYIKFKMIIKDTGVGISQEGLKNLFVDFNKLEENQQRNTSGTGLGLSICKRIVEQMGGVVNVESTLGVGTEFHIDLRAKTKHIVA